MARKQISVSNSVHAKAAKQALQKSLKTGRHVTHGEIVEDWSKK
jgi:hypothetical protein